MTPPVALTIAGSDSGGGAGIQADLRTFAALGVFATTAITAITSQNSTEVRAVYTVPAGTVYTQVQTVLDDLPVAAVKTGMLADAAIVEVVAELAGAGLLPNLVVDPVLVASTGALLTTPDTLHAYRTRLLAHARVFTPNLAEAGALLGTELRTLADQRDAARRLGESTQAVIVVTGGHAVTDAGAYAVDVVWDGRELHEHHRSRVLTANTHGSGCSFAAAVAAGLTRSMTLAAAIDTAGDFVHRSIQDGAEWRLGAGHGPLDHFGWARQRHEPTMSDRPAGPDASRAARQKEAQSPMTGPGLPEPAGFCAEAWARSEALQEAIREHPFNQALAAGTLGRQQFAFYLVQDARYLLGFSRALATASTRAPDAGTAAFLAYSSHTALVVEAQLHGRYLDRFGVTADDARRVATSPSCLAYSSYLQASALSEPFAVLAAALLPCFWIYHHIGTAISDQTRSQPKHPYRDWIDTYADQAFAESVKTMKDITDRAATGSQPTIRRAMLEAFCRASEYEWMFWDSAWRQEGWVTSKWILSPEPVGRP